VAEAVATAFAHVSKPSALLCALRPWDPDVQCRTRAVLEFCKQMLTAKEPTAQFNDSHLRHRKHAAQVVSTILEYSTRLQYENETTWLAH
jgi:hypothetical protein